MNIAFILCSISKHFIYKFFLDWTYSDKKINGKMPEVSDVQHFTNLHITFGFCRPETQGKCRNSFKVNFLKVRTLPSQDLSLRPGYMFVLKLPFSSAQFRFFSASSLFNFDREYVELQSSLR